MLRRVSGTSLILAFTLILGIAPLAQGAPYTAEPLSQQQFQPAPEEISSGAVSSVRYTTSALNMRTSPSGKVVQVLKRGTKVTLSGKKSGRWVQLTNKRWVSGYYLQSSPVKKSSAGKKKVKETSGQRCLRLSKKAASLVKIKTPKTDCSKAFTGKEAPYAGFANGFYGDPSSARVRISSSYLKQSSDTEVFQVLVHEMAHVKYISASDKKRAAHGKVLGTTEKKMFSGKYENHPGERFAQGTAVCLSKGGWGRYKPLSCKTINKALTALH